MFYKYILCLIVHKVKLFVFFTFFNVLIFNFFFLSSCVKVFKYIQSVCIIKSINYLKNKLKCYNMTYTAINVC